MLEMAPNRKKESIKVICGDSIFRGGGLLLSLGIEETCFFVADHYHLLQRDWPDYFKGAWLNLKKLFKNCIYSSSESEVQSGYRTVSYAKNWVTELTGYATWTTKFMHDTGNYLSASTLTKSLAISTG
jgi:hypothetical protein